MTTRLLTALWMVGHFWLAAWADPPPAKLPDAKNVHFDRRTRPLDYAGPGRELPDPEDVQEVRIGYFGPSDPAHPQGGDLWCAATLAVEEVNRQGGYRGKPFRLVSGWSDSPWTAGAAHVTRMVYKDNVWAILGGIDGPTTHLAEQVVAKARLPLVSAASTDRTANSAVVPWIFSLLPGDQLQAPALAAELAARAGGKPFVVVLSEDHDSRCFMAELNRALTRRQLAPQFQYGYKASTGDLSELTARVPQSRPAAVVLVADAAASARLVRGLREAGFAGEVFGGPAMGRRRFVEEAGRAAEGVVFPLLVEPGKRWPAFQEEFKRRFQRSPDYAAACTYDAVHLLAAAVRRAGLNRARIGDALRDLSPWEGVAGSLRWDALGGNTRPVRLATIKDGRAVPWTPRSKEAPADRSSPSPR